MRIKLITKSDYEGVFRTLFNLPNVTIDDSKSGQAIITARGLKRLSDDQIALIKDNKLLGVIVTVRIKTPFIPITIQKVVVK